MASNLFCFALAFLAITQTSAYIWPWQSAEKPASPAIWKDLKITLPNQHIFTQGKYFFDSVPTTKSQAITEKWTSISNGDCTNGGKYNGFRYIPADAPSIAAIYNSAGGTAGLQILYDKAQIQTPGKNGKANTYNFNGQSLINTENITINGVTKPYYVITAYFEDPSTICSSTKTEAIVKSIGFGNQLYFQNGTTPASFMQIAQKRADANSQGWNNNRCLPLNGNHNFYHVEEWQSTNCDNFLPIWLFYNNNNELSGFGFSIPGMDNSPRLQHPPGSIVQYVLNQDGNTCAKATADNIGYSNMNVYFTPNPALIMCTGDVPQWIKDFFSFFG